MNHHESKPQREQQVTSLAGTFARTPEEVFVGHRSSGAPVAPCGKSGSKTKNPPAVKVEAKPKTKQSERIPVIPRVTHTHASPKGGKFLGRFTF